jgi:hypothetical protein
LAASVFLVERHTGFIDLSVRTRAGVGSYVFGAALTLDAAYAGTTAMKTLPRNRTYRSRTLRQSGRDRVEESNRGLTRFAYDPVDYASATIPGDDDITFVRVTEVDLAGNNLGEGPILAVPPAGYFGSGRSSIVLNGTAPALSGRASNLPPTTAMAVDFPRFTDEVRIFNDDGTNSIFMAFGYGSQEIEIPAETDLIFPQTGVSLVLLRGEGGACAFRMAVVLVNGIQG